MCLYYCCCFAGLYAVLGLVMLVVCASGLVMVGVFQLVYSLPVQSHVLASVHTLKIPNADSHTIVRAEQKYSTH